MVSSDQDELLSVGSWNSTVKLKPNYVLISRFFIGPIMENLEIDTVGKEDRERGEIEVKESK